MIIFFRRIRQRLIKETKTSVYLKYAIGEVVLVVIGILIAININAWNENRKNNKAQIKDIKGILVNLESDISTLEYNIVKDSLRLDSYSYVLRAFTDKRRNDSLLKSHLLGSLLITHFTEHKTVFEDMKSSGRLNFIKSDTIRFKIQEYYYSSTAMLERQEVNNQSIVDIVTVLFSETLDINSVIEPAFAEIYRVEIDDFDASFFEQDIHNDDVRIFSNRISIMKGAVYLNLASKLEQLRKARQLKRDLSEYLSTKQRF